MYWVPVCTGMTSKMPSTRLLAGERILLTLWVGGLWTIGYIVAPALFANLEDRALAGTLAGAMFNIIAWVGLACGSLLLLFNQLRASEKRINLRAVVLVLMLILIAIGQFVLTPKIAALRVDGLVGNEAFATLHGIASVAYLITSVLGLVLVVAREEN